MIYLFTDSSCSKSYGVGCYTLMNSINDLPILNTITLPNKSSTEMEFLTILYSLNSTDINDPMQDITIYTDCAGFIQYCQTGMNHSIDDETHQQLQNHFINHKIMVNKIKGHSKQDNIITREQEIFRMIDKHARKTLRSIPN